MKTFLYMIALCTGIQTISAMEGVAVIQSESDFQVRGQELFQENRIESEFSKEEEALLCPICLEEVSEKEVAENLKAVAVTCCKAVYHQQCLNQWIETANVATCPSCRSLEEKVSIRGEVTCHMCYEVCGLRDSVVRLKCEVPVSSKNTLMTWWLTGAKFTELPSAAAQAFFSKTQTIVHHFHEACLRTYYETDKNGHDDNFGEISLFCPVHKENKVLLNTMENLKLPDKTIMTDEEVRILAEKLHKQDLERITVNNIIITTGGIPIQWSPYTVRRNVSQQPQ